MKRCIRILTGLIIITANSLLLAYQDNSYERYQSAKEHRIAGEWDEAIDTYQKMIDESPQSIYHDDAMFWIGYCLEKIPGRELEAFLAYENLLTTFPYSTWKDDALMHQLDLARVFWNNGREEYKSFFEKQSRSDIESVRTKAQAVLAEMEAQLPGEKTVADSQHVGVNLKAVYSAENARIDLDEAEKEDDDFLFFPTDRYKRYRKMLRNDDEWTKEELFDFGMWTILEDEQASDYFALIGYDRKEWYRKFWVQKDPTPTTEENEALLEFERRVLHSKAYFGQLVDYKLIRYLRDQDMRDNWYHAPWDARGEIYIKFGEPDYSTIAGFRQVEWTYYNLHADFIINQHMTNIYGNAITPGPLAAFYYSENLGYIDAEYIYKSDFHYIHRFDNEPIEDVQVGINGNIMEYSIPYEEIATNSSGNQEFIQSYVIYNDDMNIILGDVSTQKLLNHEEPIQKRIILNLKPGEYMMALRIEDLNSDKLGIFIKTFLIKDYLK